MRSRFHGFLAGFFSLLCLGIMVTVSAAADFDTIDTRTLQNLLSTSEATVIDVRADADWSASDVKIRGAERASPGYVDFWVSKYPKDEPIVLYCASPDQATSIKVARKLLAAGFTDVAVLEGGWNAWQTAQLPTERK